MQFPWTYKWEKSNKYRSKIELINLENFDLNLLKIDKKNYKGIDVYYIGCIAIKIIDDCENIYSENLLYLLVNHASGYIEDKNGNKYFIFDVLLTKTKDY